MAAFSASLSTMSSGIFLLATAFTLRTSFFSVGAPAAADAEAHPPDEPHPEELPLPHEGSEQLVLAPLAELRTGAEAEAEGAEQHSEADMVGCLGAGVRTV